MKRECGVCGGECVWKTRGEWVCEECGQCWNESDGNYYDPPGFDEIASEVDYG